MKELQEIRESEVYQQILKDSFGGVMYDVANRGKYNADHILFLWQHLPEMYKESAGGIMKGAFDFITEK